MIKIMFKFLFLGFSLMLITQPTNGQRLLKKLQETIQEKVEEKVEERTEQKVDEAIDKQLDKVEESIDKNSSEEKTSPAEKGKEREARMQNMLKGIGMSGEPVPVADHYTFKNLIEMQIETYDKNGKKESQGSFITHLNPENRAMAYEAISGDIGQSGQGIFIIDAENGATIILNEEKGEKTGIVYGISAFFSSIGETIENENIAETPEAYLTNPNVKKTGRTKKIAGYSCDEYRYNDETSESEIWITQDLKMNTQDFFSTLFKTNLYAGGIPWGYMMETTSIDKESGEKSFMQVTRVDSDSDKRFNLSDYQITNLGSFTMPSGEK